MNHMLKTLFVILLLSFIPAQVALPNGIVQSTSQSVQDDTARDPDSKVKTNPDETFFSIQINRLSLAFFARMAIDFLAVFILIRLIYFRTYKVKELFFTFIIFNFVIFLITHLLNNVDMGMGAAFGLFAVFSMLRYRTENIDTKDMTYPFLSITIGLITAIAKASALELCILNGAILGITFLLEGGILLKREMTKSIQYEQIELIRPENRDKLIADLKARTGLDIHRIAIGKIDFLKDTAWIKVYYSEKKGNPAVSDQTDFSINGQD